MEQRTDDNNIADGTREGGLGEPKPQVGPKNPSKKRGIMLLGRQIPRPSDDDPLDKWVSEKLGEQFRRSLAIEFQALKPTDTSDAAKNALFERGLRLLEPEDFSWQNGYEAEQIKVKLVSDDQLDVELSRAVNFAQRLNVDITSATPLLTPLDKGASSEDIDVRYHQIRAKLAYLVNDTQWAAQKKFARRELRARYVKAVCKTTIPVGLLFFAALTWAVSMSNVGFRVYLASYLPFVELKDAKEFFLYPGLLIAIASGVLGAWFSMLASTDKRLSGLTLEELRVAQKTTSLWARLIFGASAAVIFYFLLRSNMINGTVLPDLNQIGFVELVKSVGTKENPEEQIVSLAKYIPSMHMCLLIVWCVIVGFSEKLIPATLTRNADKLDKDASPE